MTSTALPLPKRFTDYEAADILDVHVETVRRHRRAGRLGFLKVGARVWITENHIHDFIERCEVKPCAESLTDQPKSQASGSADGRAAEDGVRRGTTGGLDRPAVNRLAQTTFKPRKSPSPRSHSSGQS